MSNDLPQHDRHAPDVAPFLPSSASPDAEGKTVPQGEVQAWCLHRTGLADPPGLVSLP
jgi:hypothetical protein